MKPYMKSLGTMLAAAALIAAAAMPAWAEPTKLTILHVNDLDRMEEDRGRGGVAKLAAVIKAERAARDNVLVTNAGDAISPSLMSSFDQGAHMIDLYNATGFDVMVAGNHEYDFGPVVATERFQEASFPILATNSIDADGEIIDGAQATWTTTVGDFTIGFLGLTKPDTSVISSPGTVTFASIEETAAERAKELREAGVDLVIALAHVDLGEDDDLIAQKAVDIILSGDDHVIQTYYDGRVALVESSSQAEYVTALDLTLDRIERRGSLRFVWRPNFRTIDTSAVEPDADMAARVQGYLDQLSAELDVKIGSTGTQLDSRRASVRTGETAIGNLIADAMREAVEADIAITNGGGIRADRIYDPGTTLTRRDIQSELPFGNKTVLLELTGADVVAALENGFSRIEDVSGRFPQVSGLKV
ncbi:MAG: bifunctional metallophosphatase/5'-nucleotidase, partial [Alphaproteobacteria bacterium]